MTRSRVGNEPPSFDPNIAHIVRMLEEERQVARVELQAVREELQASREERQANLAVIQHLVQATNQGRITGRNEEPRSKLRDFQKTNPPMFSQSKEPLDAADWLSTIENDLAVAGVGDNEKVLYATHYLTGTARSWWEGIIARLPKGEVLNWEQFKEKFRKAHIPSALIRRMKEEFRNLKQGGMTVVDYLNQFTQLSRYAPEDVDTEEKRKDQFLNGLDDELQCILVAMLFPDMEALANAAILIADKMDVVVENRKRRMMQQGGPSNPRLRHTQSVSLAPSAQRNFNSAPQPSYPNQKDPTPQPNTPAPAPGRKARIKSSNPCRIAKPVDGHLNHVNVEEAQEAPDVILGTFLVNSVPAQVLFDSGASHSFVTESFMDRSRMMPELLRRRMLVQIPGARIKASRVCPDIPVEIHGAKFPADLVVLGTEGLDVILGVNWLTKHHGRIDFTLRTVNLTSAEGVHVMFTAKLEPPVA